MYFTATRFLGNQIIIWEIDGMQYSCSCDTDNKDYQTYLAWVAEGNEATEWTGN
jgi:hypothetical protein